MSESAWQPIDTAPKDGSLLVVADGEERDNFVNEWLPWVGVDLARWLHGFDHFVSEESEFTVLYRPRWWMPIPDVPGREP